ncbi:MAG: acetyltransferase, partial [Gammaproteobacteria bacterium]|nr:acetyltransferase [Gammaproteobacteria bacterium]
MNGNIKFRKFVENDIPLFYKWAEVEHVKNSWFQDGYEPKEMIIEKVAGNGYDYPFVIELEGRPIGYIQYSDLAAYYHENPDAKSTYYIEEPPGTVCMDLFIADESCLNKGYGTKVVKSFSNYLLDKSEIKKIMIDPSVSNKRAIKCYQKA